MFPHPRFRTSRRLFLCRPLLFPAFCAGFGFAGGGLHAKVGIAEPLSVNLRQSAEPQEPTNPQQPPAQLQVGPPVPKRPPIRFVLLRKLYQCADGVQVTVVQDRESARVTLNNRTYVLKLVPSNDSGTKYTAGAITWSMAGDTGTLQDATDPASPKALANNCRQQSILPPASSSSSPTNFLRGTLNFPQGAELPSAAEIRIQLVDRKSPSASHKPIAVKTFKPPEGKPPVPFELTFNPQNVPSPDCCALSAEILLEGKAVYATSKPQPIADLRRLSPFTLDLVPVGRKTAQP